jgi:hypothetical protein
MELWTNESYGQEPNNWKYNDGTGLVYGTNNIIRSYDGVDPLTTTKVTGTAAFGGSGSSALLETKNAVGNLMISNGYTTIPGYLYRQEAITNTNIGSLTFNFKSTVVQGDSCFVKVGLIDASFNIYSLGVFWIKPSDNSTSWQSKTIILENQLAGTPTEIFIEAMSTYDESYAFNTPIIGSKLYLDNFTLNYCTTPITTNSSETICDYMLPYTWNDVVFTGAGNQSATLQNQFGCDSIVNMSLTVLTGPYTLIPDIEFETKLVDLGLDPCGIDGKVPTNNLTNVLSLSIGSGYDVTNMTGIEAFTNLETLSLSSNMTGFSTYSGVNLLNGINLSNNLALQDFSCNRCGLENIDLSNNSNLTHLNLGSVYLNVVNDYNNNNQIGTLDLSSNNMLQIVDIDRAGINNLILPNTTSLTNLDCSNNNLNSLNLSNVPNLNQLNANNNVLVDLGATNHGSLDSLNVSSNGFSGLNLSGYSQLKYIDCSSNYLECLNLKNGNNSQITFVKTTNNFNLICIEVDDSTYSTNNPIWNFIDPWTSYSEDCAGLCFTADVSVLNKDSFHIYPNPSNGLISIKSEGAIVVKIEIFNQDSRLLSIHENPNSINVSNLTPGIYHVLISTQEGNVVTQKMIKN